MDWMNFLFLQERAHDVTHVAHIDKHICICADWNSSDRIKQFTFCCFSKTRQKLSLQQLERASPKVGVPEYMRRIQSQQILELTVCPWH